MLEGAPHRRGGIQDNDDMLRKKGGVRDGLKLAGFGEASPEDSPHVVAVLEGADAVEFVIFRVLVWRGRTVLNARVGEEAWIGQNIEMGVVEFEVNFAAKDGGAILTGQPHAPYGRFSRSDAGGIEGGYRRSLWGEDGEGRFMLDKEMPRGVWLESQCEEFPGQGVAQDDIEGEPGMGVTGLGGEIGQADGGGICVQGMPGEEEFGVSGSDDGQGGGRERCQEGSKGEIAKGISEKTHEHEGEAQGQGDDASWREIGWNGHRISRHGLQNGWCAFGWGGAGRGHCDGKWRKKTRSPMFGICDKSERKSRGGVR